MVVLRDSEEIDTTVGLTRIGDEVTLKVNSRGIVSLSSFQNLTINMRIGK